MGRDGERNMMRKSLKSELILKGCCKSYSVERQESWGEEWGKTRSKRPEPDPNPGHRGKDTAPTDDIDAAQKNEDDLKRENANYEAKQTVGEALQKAEGEVIELKKLMANN
ncbi:hypothetical protein GJAV_G00229610 [Gymnothorax javanicus]|nr:hypothetical protein GJAV_G00229610 [Gymnothorax javanicus]